MSPGRDMNSLIRNILPLMPRSLVYCDVGARWGIGDPWKSFEALLGLLRFEPDGEEYASLMKKRGQNDLIFQYALYREAKDIPLNVTKSRGCSSLYEPNFECLNHYADVKRFEIERVVDIPASSLDLLFGAGVFAKIDFIKIDVQGAELDILKGGQEVLSKQALGMEIEVEFQPLYKGQPLFSDIDVYIRDTFGLQIQDLKKTYWKHPVGIDVGAAKGQLIFGDALYFRSPYEVLPWCSQFDRKEAADKILMACLMGVVYGYLDYSLCLLNQPSLGDFLDSGTIGNWRSLLLRYGRNLKYRGSGVRQLAAFFEYFYRFFQPVHEGWAVSGQRLGSKKWFGVFC